MSAPNSELHHRSERPQWAAGTGDGQTPTHGQQDTGSGHTGVRRTTLSALTLAVFTIERCRERSVKRARGCPSPPPHRCASGVDAGHRPQRLRHLLPAERKPNYSRVINLKPIRIFPSTCARSQEPDTDRSDGPTGDTGGAGQALRGAGVGGALSGASQPRTRAGRASEDRRGTRVCPAAVPPPRPHAKPVFRAEQNVLGTAGAPGPEIRGPFPPKQGQPPNHPRPLGLGHARSACIRAPRCWQTPQTQRERGPATCALVNSKHSRRFSPRRGRDTVGAGRDGVGVGARPLAGGQAPECTGGDSDPGDPRLREAEGFRVTQWGRETPVPPHPLPPPSAQGLCGLLDPTSGPWGPGIRGSHTPGQLLGSGPQATRSLLGLPSSGHSGCPGHQRGGRKAPRAAAGGWPVAAAVAGAAWPVARSF